MAMSCGVDVVAAPAAQITRQGDVPAMASNVRA